jgi:hypothetical protein
MSSNASEARRLPPDRRKGSKDHDISNHNYTSRDEHALHVLIPMSLLRTAWSLVQLRNLECINLCAEYTLATEAECGTKSRALKLLSKLS